jgi:hypothetical protein
VCGYCSCRENDNTRYHGMRLGSFGGDSLDHQSDENYTWNKASVGNNATFKQSTPLVGYGSTIGNEVVASPVKVGTDGR